MEPQKTVEVETGLTTDTYVEIKSGLAEGDSVQIAQRSSSSNNNSSGFGAMGGTMPGGMPTGNRQNSQSSTQKSSSGQTKRPS